MASTLGSFRVDESSVHLTGEKIGAGAYGEVCKAEYNHLSCAAKLLHSIFEQHEEGNFLVRRFEQECWFLNNFKHPNIVLGLGAITDPRKVLLMELMDQNLTRVLERSSDPIPLVDQIDICYDISLALSYMHSVQVMHRDLSSNNVLFKGKIAKLADFGMSVKLTDEENTKIRCPGTPCYMPPNALQEPIVYGPKIDCFSFGVLTVQIATGKFPDAKGRPGDGEIQRRKEHIGFIEPGHPLLSLALHCLEDLESRRPSADDICNELSSLKCSLYYQNLPRWHTTQRSKPDNVADTSASISPTTPTKPQAPTKLTDYQEIGDLILSKNELGSGAFGSVFKATFKQKSCAAKMLSNHARDLFRGMKTGSVQEARKACIQRECKFLESLKHKNIIHHFATVIEPFNMLPILVMELMDCNLKKFIIDNKPLSYEFQLTVCQGVANGLHYLHTNNIIHRDLCDDNILLKREFRQLTVKISDFGMSKMLDYTSMSATITAVGHRKGYLPPEGEGPESSDEEEDDESIDYNARYSHRLDIYSFGAVATQTVQSADQFVTRRDLKRAFKRIEYDHPLRWVIEKCLIKDTKLRPSAETLSEHFNQLLPPK